MNDTLSEENLKAFEEWNKHDAAQQDSFCEPDGNYACKKRTQNCNNNKNDFKTFKTRR